MALTEQPNQRPAALALPRTAGHRGISETTPAPPRIDENRRTVSHARQEHNGQWAGHGKSTASPAGHSLLVIILNFNGIEDTLACLESLRAQTYQGFVVQVIDNGSRTDDLMRIVARFPDAEVVALPENLGWAGGNNVGLRLARDRNFDHVCLLNNDTVLDPPAIAELLAAAASLHRPCLLHPTIAYFDDPTRWQLNPQPGSADDKTTGQQQTLPDLVEMDFAYGACLMLPASVLQEVGLLDERFFLQLEETDYFHRAKALGIPSFCARRARILHKESASFGGQITANKTYYQVRNSLLLTEKHTPTLKGFFYTLRGLVWTLHGQAGVSRTGIAGWLGLIGWIVSVHPLACAARQGAGDYLRRRFGQRPAVKTVS